MKNVLITGGTGSLGKALCRRLLADPDGPETIRTFSRDEDKHRIVRRDIEDPDDRIRTLVGDVRDRERLEVAMRGVDTVIHAAAMKQVPLAEYNPSEAVKTNVMGSMNVVSAALRTESVTRCMLISTDKATAALNLYGSTKHTAEKLFQAANVYAGHRDLRFSAVRYGNVTGSRGSVINVWREAAKAGMPLPITDERMTRFWMSLDDAVEFVLSSIERMNGGEVFIPKPPAYRVADLMRAVAPLASSTEIGIRPGEKLHEVLISEDEMPCAWDLGDRYALIPPKTLELDVEVPEDASPMARGWEVSSGDETRWLSREELEELVRPYVGRAA